MSGGQVIDATDAVEEEALKILFPWQWHKEGAGMFSEFHTLSEMSQASGIDEVMIMFALQRHGGQLGPNLFVKR